MRASFTCQRTHVKGVRRSAQKLMQAYWHSLPRASCARARQLGYWRTSLALRPLPHPLPRTQDRPPHTCTTTRHTAWPHATLRAPQEPLHTGTTSPSCRSAPVRGSAPRRNRYVDARTPPATAQPGRPLRRRPSRYVETIRTGRGFYYVAELRILANSRSPIEWCADAHVDVKDLDEGRACSCFRKCADMGAAVTTTAIANRYRSCSCLRT